MPIQRDIFRLDEVVKAMHLKRNPHHHYGTDGDFFLVDFRYRLTPYIEIKHVNEPIRDSQWVLFETLAYSGNVSFVVRTDDTERFTVYLADVQNRRCIKVAELESYADFILWEEQLRFVQPFVLRMKAKHKFVQKFMCHLVGCFFRTPSLMWECVEQTEDTIYAFDGRETGSSDPFEDLVWLFSNHREKSGSIWEEWCSKHEDDFAIITSILTRMPFTGKEQVFEVVGAD